MRSVELLRKGVEQGIITNAQQASLLALESESAPGREAPRGVNAITIAYGVGALIVLFAFAWLLIDRWRVLGNGGLLGLSLLYAALFLLAAHVLKREGFPTARGLAVLLAVGMTPVATMALGRLLGIWPADAIAQCGGPVEPFFPCGAEPLTLELAVAAAALMAMRRISYAPLVIPLAVAGLLVPMHLSWALAGVDIEWGSGTMGWAWLMSGSLMAAAAQAVDRRPHTEDYALWLHVAAAVAGLIACAQLFEAYPELRHFTGLVALLAFVSAIYFRRRVYLAMGAVLAFGYLAWLAFVVFRVTVAFPLVLAAIGLGLIVASVWLQRRFPALVARAAGSAHGPPRFPGGIAVLLAPALLAILMFPDGVRRDAEFRLTMRARGRAMHGSMRQSAGRRDAAARERRQQRER
jgi:hypothetical protein